MYDYIIQNAQVYNGLGDPAQNITVGIKNGKIDLLNTDEQNLEAKTTINAEGMILSPGFIDPHASTGLGYFFDGAATHKLYQGITTEVFGNCGVSPAPIGEHLIPTMEDLSQKIGFPFSWRTLEEYFEKIEHNLQFNIATLIGHNTLRIGSMKEWGELKAAQLVAMKQALKFSMAEGALGLSTALIEAPGCYADIQEVIELAKLVAEKGGVYASHIRNERNKVEIAVEEALLVSKVAKVKTLLSHFKIRDKNNWGKIDKVLEQLDRFNKENPTIPVAIDVYPYTAMTNKLKSYIPKYLLDNDNEKLHSEEAAGIIKEYLALQEYDMNQMLIVSDESAYFGKNIATVAKEKNCTAEEAILLILEEDINVWAAYQNLNQEDVDKAILWDRAMICTDSWSYPVHVSDAIDEEPHPRSYGAFTSYLERYVLDQKSLSWEEAIHKVTHLPASFFGLKDRGQISDGYAADLILINPSKLKARATYIEPRALSEGVEYLWVNGQLVIEEGSMKEDMLPGQILKSNQKQSVSPLV